MKKNKKLLMLVVPLLTFFINSNMVYADICSSMPKTLDIIKELLGIVKIAIPILLIVLGTVDFIKAMVAQDDQQMKKAQGAFVKRLIIGVVIFFVPMIMKFLLSIIGYGDNCLYDIFSF